MDVKDYFNKKITNTYVEGWSTNAKMLKRISFGLKNTEVYVRKMMCEFSPLEAFHTI
ncbi:transposase [Acetomicrobium mobile]|uniref:transposase n=1 Tax=Acetomicrobium mobile TaxID=97477 RepID=UPI0016A5FCEF|nr:transposase [Synergistaceae bacterium]